MEHRCVMFVSKLTSDLRERHPRYLLGQVHTDLTGQRDRLGIIPGLQILDAHAEVICNGLLDHLNGDRLLVAVKNLTQSVLSQGQCDLRLMKGGEGDQSYERSLEFPDIRFDLTGDIQSNVIRKRDVLEVRFLREDCDLCFQIGRLDVCDQTPFKPGVKPLLESRNVSGWAIRREYELFMRVVEGVESMKELFLSPFFCGDELDVVYKEDVIIAIAFPEAEHLVIADRTDQVVGELFRGDIGQTQTSVPALDFVSDGMHQVGLPKTDTSIHEQRVISF